MGRFCNTVGNAVGIVPRTLGTVGLTALDALKTGANVLTDVGSVVKNTSNKLREVLSSSWNTGKRYNKLYQVPAGLAIGAGTLVEGAVRTVFEPTRNAFLNVRDTSGNFFLNIGNTLKRTFKTDRPVSDFRFEKIQMKNTSNKNWVSNWAWWNKGQLQGSAQSSVNSSTTTNNTVSEPANSNQLSGLQSQIATLTTQIGQLQTSLRALQTQNQQLQAQNEQLQNANRTLQAQIAASQARQSSSTGSRSQTPGTAPLSQSPSDGPQISSQRTAA